MCKIIENFKHHLYIVLFILCFGTKDAKANLSQMNFISIHFDEMKHNLFYQNDKNPPKMMEELKGLSSSCWDEMDRIKMSLENSSEWAFKVLDSWGKVPPSALYSGNLYDFGGFSQCLNIQRGGETYKTQYCFGQLILEVNFNPLSKYKDSNGDTFITSEYLLPQPDNGFAINFGLCLPSVCPVRMIEPIMNHFIRQKTNYTSIKIIEDTCQSKESANELRNIDVAVLTFFVICLCLVLMSTSYDMFCTINSCDKSEILLAFSFYTNGKKLFSKSLGKMDCLHGIRAISTIWVILGHTFVMYSKIPSENLVTFITFVSKYHSMLLYSAPMTVDTFFTMSGFLLAFKVSEMIERKVSIRHPYLYIHRYIRLTPLLDVCILFTVSLFKFCGSGPLWPQIISAISGQCDRNWWVNLLYLQNYVRPDDMCFVYSWHLAVDFQLFLIGPALVYLIYRYPAKAIAVSFALILSCVGFTVAIYLTYDLQSFRQLIRWSLGYYPTHLRYSPWLVGIIGGYLLFRTRNKSIRIPKVLNLFAWTMSLASMVAIIFLNYPLMQLDAEYTSLHYALYDSLSRIIWAIALCYIIFACTHNHGGPVNWLLAHPMWQPISRLSYSMYLIHFFVIRMTMGTIKTSAYFSEWIAIQAFIANLMITIVVSTVATLTLESPLIVIEKLIIRSKSKAKKKN